MSEASLLTNEMDQLISESESHRVQSTKKTKKGGAKPNAIYYNDRLRTVAGWILSGYSRADIHNMIADKDWGKRRNANIMIKKAQAIYADILDHKQKLGLVEPVARREMLYQKACEEKDWKLALTILQDLDRLLGNYSPDVTVSEVYNKDIENMTNDELAEVAKLGLGKVLTQTDKGKDGKAKAS